MEWWIWVSGGILCLIIEIGTPGFYFFSIGMGAIVSGIFARFFGFTTQLIVFSIVTIISYLLMKRFAGVLLKSDTKQSNIYALVDKTGIVVDHEISPTQRGYVKIAGETWSAISTNPSESIAIGTFVKIVKTEGNKVIVTPLNEQHIE